MSQLVVGEAGCLLTICWTESIVVELAGGMGVGDCWESSSRAGSQGSGEPELSLDRRLAREKVYPLYPRQRKQQEPR